MVPMIDIHTIGAGGGSIAYVDSAGEFQVGPQSAGAVPGPAAYGEGGDKPTVTDANVVLGRLEKDNFLGGAMTLDERAARRVIGELAGKLGLSEMEAAEGVVTILNSNMANAIRSRTVQKGIDPRDYALVAFGGAGPLHGAEVAAMLSIPEVIVPPHPGITSAVGLLTTDLKYDAIKTEFQVSNDVDFDRLNRDYEDLEKSLRQQFKADGIDPGSATFERFGELRYLGQGYELRVAMPEGRIGQDNLQKALGRFQQQHEQEFGHFFPDSPVEIVNIRVNGVGATPKIGRPGTAQAGTLAEALVKKDASVFRVDGALREFETAFYRRGALPVEETIAGPAVILQTDSTTVVPPGCSMRADRNQNLIIKVGG